ncbi:DUF6843 domain-containing protein [Bacillus weihaiensis]|uniref:DUF6843 domain-containing protein n=1 Tax=Bacillus weihaiensis TaxID=1547283 RepID=UPI0023532688|nr:hypothetical protein [Bacillus weihaiensis]
MIKKLVLFLFICHLLTGCKQDDQVSPKSYLIPMGYTGWVKVQYEDGPINTSTSKPDEYRVNKDGIAITHDPHIHEGWATNHYYYVDQEGKRTKLVPGKMVHGTSSGMEQGGETTEYFFIGTSEQFEKDHYISNE